MNKFYFRKKRFKKFFQLLNIDKSKRIVDVGGLPWDWLKLKYGGPVLCLSLSNLKEGKYGDNENIEYRKQDASKLPFDDNSQLVYSNSLLEHVGKENQIVIAQEIARISNKYWVQVPYKYFFYEPHYKFPFFHLYPKLFRKIIAKYWTSKFLKHPHYLNEVETIHLPTQKEFEKLFPGATIKKERFLGFTKSLIAYRA